MSTSATAPKLLPIIGQPSEERSRDLVLKTSSNELIFAVVGHVGSGTGFVAKALESLLKDGSICGEPFDVHILKARTIIEEWARKNSKSLPDPSAPRTLKSVETLQDYGDQMRGEKTASGHEDHSAVARALVLEIRKTRAKSMGIAATDPLPVELDRRRRAYILDSLRHPEEANLLRRLYQDAFLQIGIVCEESDSGIMKWPTSAVCFGPPLGQSELLVCTERELRTGAGVGLENQGGTLRADSPGV